MEPAVDLQGKDRVGGKRYSPFSLKCGLCDKFSIAFSVAFQHADSDVENSANLENCPAEVGGIGLVKDQFLEVDDWDVATNGGGSCLGSLPLFIDGLRCLVMPGSLIVREGLVLCSGTGADALLC
jgi:hypothetical protein